MTVGYPVQERIDAVLMDLANVCGDVEVAVRDATRALMTGRADIAERVIDADDRVNAARARVEDAAIEILSLQAPVATNLRVVVSALAIVSDLERMGDLAVHVAKVARLRTPHLAVPETSRPTIDRMAEIAEQMVARTAEVIRKRDLAGAEALREHDDEMDALRRDSFQQVLGPEWTGGVEAAVDLALLGRYYERIADHAVAVADRVEFIVTGEAPQ
jgi:phosphate transport system protein